MKKILIYAAIAAIAAASAVTTNAQAFVKNARAEAEIKAVFDITAVGWNTGDLTKYLYAYVPDATEMLSTGPTGGVEAIEKTMKEGFWKTGRPLQNLRYESLVVRMLGKENALVTGQYILSGADKPDRKGWFTTVWTKTKSGWRMIHDHS